MYLKKKVDVIRGLVLYRTTTLYLYTAPGVYNGGYGTTCQEEELDSPCDVCRTQHRNKSTAL